MDEKKKKHTHTKKKQNKINKSKGKKAWKSLALIFNPGDNNLNSRLMGRRRLGMSQYQTKGESLYVTDTTLKLLSALFTNLVVPCFLRKRRKQNLVMIWNLIVEG